MKHAVFAVPRSGFGGVNIGSLGQNVVAATDLSAPSRELKQGMEKRAATERVVRGFNFCYPTHHPKQKYCHDPLSPFRPHGPRQTSNL
ncbi:MAG: hypothetical protein WCH44_05525 [Betaproteobacteria bacterium]